MGFKIADDQKGKHYAEVVRDWCRRNCFTQPVPEFKFLPKRKFRFDLAWPDPNDLVAVEFQGGNWTGGRHVRGRGFELDCEKFSFAAVHGWRIIHVTYDQIDAGLLFQWIEAIFPVIE